MGRGREVPSFRVTLFADTLDKPVEVATDEEDGSFQIYIGQRDQGYFTDAYEITGHKEGDTLLVDIRNRNGVLVAQNKTRW
ncbi:MAG: hypothetical protein ACYC1C_14715 [Chloroflexota bacterium]